MKNLKYLLLLLLPAFAVAPSCQTGPDVYTFKGTVANAANLQVLLEQVFFDQNAAPTAIGRVSCDASGKFSIESKTPFNEGLYRLTIGAKRMFFMLGEKDKAVEFTGDLNTIDRLDVKVTGSETFACYTKVIQEMIGAGQINPEAATSFVEKSCNPLMRAFVTMQLFGRNAGDNLEKFKNVRQELNDKMPKSQYTAEFTKIVASLESQMQTQDAGAAIKVGQPAPDISLPGPDGKTRSLSSLKGKVVLLDFWASWCRPCRMANPHVVEVYNKYKDKGFDVFSVSLDRPGQKDAWVAAIKQDGLVWDGHVSDLQFWSSAPAGVYGVRSIPSTFLIDRQGNISAINPRTDLEAQLLKVL